MKNVHLTLFLICLSAVLQGCLQQDTVGDEAQQDCDRQNQIANTLSDQYSQVKGQYEGTYNESTLLLSLDVPRQATNSTGGCAPQPVIEGGLSMVPAIHVKTATGQPMLVQFAVTSGQYVNGNDLSLTVMQGGASGAPTTAHCSVSDSHNDLDCEWYVDASTVTSAHFLLHRVTDGEQALSSGPSRSQGEYTGSDSFHQNIVAIFETEEDVQTGSTSIPQVTIGGTISLDGVAYHFKGGEFDPINNTLALDISGTNPITVNCTVLTADKLRCVWSGKNGNGTPGNDGEDEVFDLTKTS